MHIQFVIKADWNQAIIKAKIMHLLEPYNVLHASNRSERETPATASQEDDAYNVNERSPTQTDEDTEYSIVENNGEERHTMEQHCRRKTPSVFWT